MAKKKTGKSREFSTSLFENNESYNKYFWKLVELSCNLFEWKNLPKTVNERFLEMVLLDCGSILFFKDDGLDDYFVMRYSLDGNLDVYGEPLDRRAYSSYNGYNAHYDNQNSVIIWNNSLHTGSTRDIMDYANEIWDIERTILVNANAQKTPILLVADENDRLTLLNIYQQYQGNVPVIYGKKTINKESLQVLSTGAPYVASDLFDLKQQIWNEALTFIGIPNLNIGKKERLVQDEVSTNNGSTTGILSEKLEMRKKACEQINEMFGLNIEVNLRENYLSMMNNISDKTNKSNKKENESGD